MIVIDNLPTWATLDKTELPPIPDWIRNTPKRGSLDYRLYTLRARLITTVFRTQWFPLYDPTLYQLDHRYSILDGFRHNVPPMVISARHNLELTTKRFNEEKWSQSSITLQQLYDGYNPDKSVSELTKLLLSIRDEDTLIRWSLAAHEQSKQLNQQAAQAA